MVATIAVTIATIIRTDTGTGATTDIPAIGIIGTTMMMIDFRSRRDIWLERPEAGWTALVFTFLVVPDERDRAADQGPAPGLEGSRLVAYASRVSLPKYRLG